MKKTLLYCCCVLLLTATGFKNAETLNYTIDTKASSLKWTGHAQTGVYSPSGTINVKSGKVSMNQYNMITSANIVIDMTTLHQDKEEMENHLKGADFFDVANFPEAQFKFTGVKGITARGQLTVKGVTHEISFPLTVTHHGDQIEVKANLEIDRTLYGIKYNSTSYFQDLGSYAIKNIFDLEVDIYGIKAN
ncbi:YceI family protein [Mucilaginibacter flavus]|uniref:YceI family protein n=1 Tax=Mucilaginibacter flavus TaxID=931504 RepID=UPI0025B5F82F|nr:YceI family protein [Mucilaginibacter flavus]MDN3584647.1 YceI family protein [Mucilaginibacter flavus]